MERDINLIREILISLTKKVHSGPSEMLIKGFSRELISYHCQLLVDNGYLTAFNSSLGTVLPRGLTISGREFANSIKDWRLWDKVVASVREQGVSLEDIKIIAHKFNGEQI